MNGFNKHSEAISATAFISVYTVYSFAHARTVYPYTGLYTSIFNEVIRKYAIFSWLSCPEQAQSPSSPPLQLESGLLQPWRTLPCSRGSGLRWPLCWRSGDPVTSRPSSCPGCQAGRPPTQVGTAPSAAALEDAARQPHC